MPITSIQVGNAKDANYYNNAWRRRGITPFNERMDSLWQQYHPGSPSGLSTTGKFSWLMDQSKQQNQPATSGTPTQFGGSTSMLAPGAPPGTQDTFTNDVLSGTTGTPSVTSNTGGQANMSIAPSTYNINPAPQAGKGTFGEVPGPIGLPDPYSDLSRVYPNLGGTNQELSNAIMSKLKGELSPATIAAIQDTAAKYGVSSGMPGSGLSFNKSLRDLGLASEAVQQQGLQAYGALMPVISNTQTVRPETQIGVADRNALFNAAPNPTMANNNARELFEMYLNRMGQSNGPAGGTGSYRPSPTSMGSLWATIGGGGNGGYSAPSMFYYGGGGTNNTPPANNNSTNNDWWWSPEASWNATPTTSGIPTTNVTPWSPSPSSTDLYPGGPSLDDLLSPSYSDWSNPTETSDYASYDPYYDDPLAEWLYP